GSIRFPAHHLLVTLDSCTAWALGEPGRELYRRLYGVLFVNPALLLTSSGSNSGLLRSIHSEDPRGARRRGQHLRRVLVSGWIRAGSRPGSNHSLRRQGSEA